MAKEYRLGRPGRLRLSDVFLQPRSRHHRFRFELLPDGGLRAWFDAIPGADARLGQDGALALNQVEAAELARLLGSIAELSCELVNAPAPLLRPSAAAPADSQGPAEDAATEAKVKLDGPDHPDRDGEHGPRRESTLTCARRARRRERGTKAGWRFAPADL